MSAESLESLARSMTPDVLRADAARLREMAGAEREAMIPHGDRWVAPSKRGVSVSRGHRLYMEHIAMLERAALASEMMAAMMERTDALFSPSEMRGHSKQWHCYDHAGRIRIGNTLPLALLPLLNHVDTKV